MKSWFPDLQFLTATNLPLFFTCANDYADLVGETTILRHLLGARFIAAPQENPFSYASTMVPPNTASADNTVKEGQDFSRGNSFVYAVQGCERSRRLKLDAKAAGFVQEFQSLFLRHRPRGRRPSAVALVEAALSLRRRLPLPPSTSSSTSSFTSPPLPPPSTSSSTSPPSSYSSSSSFTTSSSPPSIPPPHCHKTVAASAMDKVDGGEPTPHEPLPPERAKGKGDGEGGERGREEHLHRSVIERSETGRVEVIQRRSASSSRWDVSLKPLAREAVRDLFVSEDGNVLAINFAPRPQQKEEENGGEGRGGGELVQVQLLAQVRPSSLIAKYSKKLNGFTLSAELQSP